MTPDVETLRDLHWGFDDKGPYYFLTHHKSTPRHEYVDPAPCYSHDEALVRSLAAHVSGVAPLPLPIKIFLLSHEPLGRMNGWYSDDSRWEEVDRGGKMVWVTHPVGTITLAGKRIPLHPAMTRYLVPHEYGHAVFYHLARAYGVKDEELKTHYIETVRPETKKTYGPGKWHEAVGEIFANDFRILVARLEHEFWPHTVTRPERCLEAIYFWRQVARDLDWPSLT